MTTNAGSRDMASNRIGFADVTLGGSAEPKKVLERLFSPEFRNRLNGTVSVAALRSIDRRTSASVAPRGRRMSAGRRGGPPPRVSRLAPARARANVGGVARPNKLGHGPAGGEVVRDDATRLAPGKRPLLQATASPETSSGGAKPSPGASEKPGSGTIEFSPGVLVVVEGTDAELVALLLDDLDVLAKSSTGAALFAALAEVHQAKGLSAKVRAIDLGGGSPTAAASPSLSESFLERLKFGWNRPDWPSREELKTDGPSSALFPTVTKPGPGVDATVTFDPHVVANQGIVRHDTGVGSLKKGAAPPEECVPQFVALHHELVHALHMMQGRSLTKHRGPSDFQGFTGPARASVEEWQTIGLGRYGDYALSENALRREFGFDDRESHFDVCVTRRPGS